jgi:hypothetical protein
MDELLAHIPIALAIVILGLAFRKPLFLWLNRFGRMKAGDLSVELSSQADQQVIASESMVSQAGLVSGEPSPATAAVAAAPTNDSMRTETLKNAGIPPVIIEQEYAIRRDLEHVLAGDQQVLLIRHLAITQLNLLAEQTYRLIFGSQLEVLQHLNLYGATSKQKLVEMFYEPAAGKHSAVYSKITTEGFFRFLESNNLVVSEAQSYRLTPRGKAFLEWIVTQGILPKKLF